VVRQGVDVLLRALIAAGFLVLSSAGAFASVCTANGQPDDSLTLGGFLVQTSETTPATSPLSGTLDGQVSSGWSECDSTGTSLVSFPVTNATLPFDLPGAALVLISVSEQQPTVFGAYFDLIVDGVSYDQPAIVASATGFDDLSVTVPEGLSTLGITELTSAASFGFADGFDYLSVTVGLESYIPEPATLGLLSLGAACLAALRRRRRA
jgi:hypothetical protein